MVFILKELTVYSLKKREFFEKTSLLFAVFLNFLFLEIKRFLCEFILYKFINEL